MAALVFFEDFAGEITLLTIAIICFLVANIVSMFLVKRNLNLGE